MITVALVVTSMICCLAVTANIRLRLAVAQARDEADHDPLTGLLRRDAARKHLVQRRIRGQSTTAILLDMDDFKSINDQHGHLAGDQLLAAVGRRLATYAQCLDGSAIRLGGDEFLLLLPALNPLDHIAQTEAILDDLVMPVPVDGHDGVVILNPSATAGIATGTARDDWADLVSAADVALYKAKQTDTPYRYDTIDNPVAADRPAGRDRRKRRTSTCLCERLNQRAQPIGEPNGSIGATSAG